MKINKHHDITIGELETYLKEETELGETPEEVSKNLIKGLFTEDILDYGGVEVGGGHEAFVTSNLSYDERFKVVERKYFFKQGGVLHTVGRHLETFDNFDRRVRDIVKYGRTQYGLPTGRENRMLRLNKKL